MSNEESPKTPEDSRVETNPEAQATDPRQWEQIRAKAAQADDYLERWQRAAAELANVQKRFVKERELTRKLALRDLLRALLPSIDNLARALNTGAGTDQTMVLEGVRMVQGEIQRAVVEFGFKTLQPMGERLDPHLHEAVSRIPAPGVEDNTVIEVLESGYVLGDLVVRPARVVVAQGGGAESAKPNASPENA